MGTSTEGATLQSIGRQPAVDAFATVHVTMTHSEPMTTLAEADVEQAAPDWPAGLGLKVAHGRNVP